MRHRDPVCDLLRCNVVAQLSEYPAGVSSHSLDSLAALHQAQAKQNNQQSEFALALGYDPSREPITVIDSLAVNLTLSDNITTE